MSRKKLVVKRKAYTRKAHTRKPYTRKDGTRVKGSRVKKTKVPATTYKTKDRGLPGRTPKSRRVIPPLQKGTLGISFSDPMHKIKRKLKSLAKKRGEVAVASKLRALGVLNKNTNPKLSKKAFRLANWVSGSFKNRKYTKYPKGFGRNK